MKRRLLGFGAFLVYCTFGVMSVGAEAPVPPVEPVPLEAPIMLPSEPLLVSLDASHERLSDPAGHRECVEACKVGGKTLAIYCSRMPTPQFVAMCMAAAALGTVSCMGFCYSRFME